MNGGRDAAVTWIAPVGDGTYARVHAAQYSTALGWHTNRLLPTPAQIDAMELHVDINDAGHVDLALAASGSAICFFVDSTGPVLFDLNYRRYTPAGGWGALQSVEDAGRIGLANTAS
ncbi:MAG TPA: hypothetical protein VK698_23505, partial [Kofleriaceae bacterium]|nr:hypothetical protein [Kofleriaceae bacterium]